MPAPSLRIAANAAALEDIQRIPGVGPSLARDFVNLGIRRVDLRHRNSERLYEQLITLCGKHQDRGVIYPIRGTVYFASEPQPDPERLKW